MHVLKSITAIIVIITVYSGSASALAGHLLPSKSKLSAKAPAELSVPFFDNRKNQTKPKPSHAPKHVILGESGYGGSGCPNGTVAIALSTDNRAVSIVFDQFTSEAGDHANTKISQKSCRLLIPITAPEGYHMAVAQLDYRGFKSLPQHTHAQLKAIHQVRHASVNKHGPKIKTVENFKGPNTDDFFLSATLENKAIANNKVCGGTYNLEIEIELAVKSPQGEQVVLTLDSVDGEFKDGVDYHLQWEKCSQ